MNGFAPDSRYPFPLGSRRARVCIEPNASLPAPGSVSPHAPIFSSVTTGSAQRSFCSAVPRAITAPPKSPIDAPKAIAKPGQTRASSIIKIAWSACVSSPERPPRPVRASFEPCFARDLSNAARAMSASPKVAAIARISG